MTTWPNDQRMERTGASLRSVPAPQVYYHPQPIELCPDDPTVRRFEKYDDGQWKRDPMNVILFPPHFNNPNGIVSFSPGLRGTSYPGYARKEGRQPQRGCINLWRRST